MTDVPAGDARIEDPVGQAATGTGTRPRSRRGYFLPGVIALAVLLAIGGAMGAGDLSHAAPRQLAGTDMAQQIALGIETARGAAGPPDVTCPAEEPVRQGLRFTCRLAGASGQAVPVEVVEIDGRGHLRWSIPGSGSPGSGSPVAPGRATTPSK